MVALELIRWWYGPGYRQLIGGIGDRIHHIALIFSLPLLIRTLGAPWRRIITYSRGSLSDRFRAMLDNLISRAVGLVVRCMVILTALVAILLTSIGGVIIAIIWPLAPLAGPALIIWGLV